MQGHLTVLKVTVTVCHTAKHYGEEYDEYEYCADSKDIFSYTYFCGVCVACELLVINSCHVLSQSRMKRRCNCSDFLPKSRRLELFFSCIQSVTVVVDAIQCLCHCLLDISKYASRNYGKLSAGYLQTISVSVLGKTSR